MTLPIALCLKVIRNYSKTCLKRTCSKTDTCLKNGPKISVYWSKSHKHNLSKADKNIDPQDVRFRQVSPYFQILRDNKLCTSYADRLRVMCCEICKAKKGIYSAYVNYLLSVRPWFLCLRSFYPGVYAKNAVWSKVSKPDTARERVYLDDCVCFIYWFYWCLLICTFLSICMSILFYLLGYALLAGEQTNLIIDIR